MQLKMCEIVCDTAHMKPETIEAVAESRKAISRYVYILHDKDTKPDGTPKNPHYYILLKLKDSNNTEYIAKWFGIPENFVGRIKGRWADGLLYLTHENAPEKHRYEETEVKSSYDWVADKKAHKRKVSEKKRMEEIVSMIASGEIRPYNYTDFITPQEYVKYASAIRTAMNYRADTISQNHNRQLEVIYIVGGSGCGKSTYAKQLAEEKGMSYYVSSGSNDVLDGYCGEECLILDDLRPSCLGLSDLLKLLDNNTSTSVKSRYRNKILECRLIILTTVKEIDTFFAGVFEHEDEPLRQFKRRCRTMMRFSEERLEVSAYEDATDTYVPVKTFKNPICGRFPKEAVPVEDLKRRVVENFCLKGMEEYPEPEEAAPPSENGFTETEPDEEMKTLFSPDTDSQ